MASDLGLSDAGAVLPPTLTLPHEAAIFRGQLIFHAPVTGVQGISRQGRPSRFGDPSGRQR
jgi:hypothetical protein